MQLFIVDKVLSHPRGKVVNQEQQTRMLRMKTAVLLLPLFMIRTKRNKLRLQASVLKYCQHFEQYDILFLKDAMQT